MEYEDSPRDDNKVSITTTEDGIQLNFSVRPPSTDDVCEQIARRLMHDYSNSNRLHTMVAQVFEQRVGAWIDEHATETIRLLLDAPLQRYDRFGKPEGEPRSLLADLDNMLTTYLSVQIDSYGKPVDSSSYGSRGAPTRLQRLLLDAVGADYKKLATARVTELNREVKQMVKDRMASAVDDAIKSLGK